MHFTLHSSFLVSCCFQFSQVRGRRQFTIFYRVILQRIFRTSWFAIFWKFNHFFRFSFSFSSFVIPLEGSVSEFWVFIQVFRLFSQFLFVFNWNSEFLTSLTENSHFYFVSFQGPTVKMTSPPFLLLPSTVSDIGLDNDRFRSLAVSKWSKSLHFGD